MLDDYYIGDLAVRVGDPMKYACLLSLAFQPITKCYSLALSHTQASETAKSTGAAKTEKKASSESSGPNMLAFIVPLLVVAAAVYLKVTGN